MSGLTIPPARPLNDFFDFARFGIPPFNDPQHLVARVKDNLEYYLGNYLMIAALIFLFNLTFTLVFAILMIAGGYVFLQKNGGKGGIPRVTTKQFGAGALIVLWFLTGFKVLTIAFTALGFSIIHASTRKRSVKAKLNSFVGSVAGTNVTEQAEKRFDRKVR